MFMENINFDNKMMEIILANEKNGVVPTLLLHTCCAPCSSAVLLRLANYFHIAVFYYNPNISPVSEYLKRKEEQIRLIKEMGLNGNIKVAYCDYDNNVYEELIKGLENEPERGNRCTVCFKLRLDKTAARACQLKYDYFGTTLTVSPYKNSSLINEIGLELQDKYNIKFLVSDFKKKNGYKRSIELSKIFNLYRQDYCGCKYSKRD